MKFDFRYESFKKGCNLMMGALKRIEKIISEKPFEQKKKKPRLKFNRGLAPVGHEGSLFKRFFNAGRNIVWR